MKRGLAAFLAEQEFIDWGSGREVAWSNGPLWGAPLSRVAQRLSLALLVCLTGCAYQKRAQNPFPGVFRVAVVPFNNKSNGAAGLNTERLTDQFASELQKIPTFEVVPVQEVREVLGGARIDTNQPELAFALARAVHAQAIIVGDVTEFNTYYPPVLGLHCEMYAMVAGEPELVAAQTPAERARNGLGLRSLGALVPFLQKNKCGRCSKCGSADILMPKSGAGQPNQNASARVGQGPIDAGGRDGIEAIVAHDTTSPRERSPGDPPQGGNRGEVVLCAHCAAQGQAAAAKGTVAGIAGAAGPTQATVEDYQAARIPASQIVNLRTDPPVPVVEPWVVRHSRIFDGANLGLVYKVQDYYFFRKDLRGGDWPGYLHRSEDFTRFACNRMIFEMLDSAGGRWSTLIGVRIPQPWLPWPWR